MGRVGGGVFKSLSHQYRHNPPSDSQMEVFDSVLGLTIQYRQTPLVRRIVKMVERYFFYDSIGAFWYVWKKPSIQPMAEQLDGYWIFEFIIQINVVSLRCSKGFIEQLRKVWYSIVE